MTDPLELTFLGSGGNLPIPMPTCTCRVCEQARTEDEPYTRRGNSMFLHDANAMIDAPEHSFEAMNRADIERVDTLLLTHWHPDHVCGVRAVAQSRDLSRNLEEDDWGLLDTAREHRPTILTTERVYERTCDVVGALEHFTNVGYIEVEFLDDGPRELECDSGENVTLRPIPYELEGDGDEDAVAFVLERGDRTLLVASDDARHLEETLLPEDIDLAVFECGVFTEGPDGTRILTEMDHEFLAGEMFHGDVLDRVERVDPDRAILTEIEHLTGRSHDDFRELEAEYDRVRFAHDGLTVEV